MNLFATYHGGGKGKGSAYQNSGLSSYAGVYCNGIVHNAPLTGPITVRISSILMIDDTLKNMVNTNGSVAPVNSGLYYVNWSGSVYGNGAGVSITVGIIKNNSGALEAKCRGLSLTPTSSVYTPVSASGFFQLTPTDELSLGIYLLSGTVTVRFNAVSFSFLKVA